MHNLQLSNIKTCGDSSTVILFSNLYDMFLGYFDPVNIIFGDDTNNHFSGWANRCIGWNKNTVHLTVAVILDKLLGHVQAGIGPIEELVPSCSWIQEHLNSLQTSWYRECKPGTFTNPSSFKSVVGNKEFKWLLLLLVCIAICLSGPIVWTNYVFSFFSSIEIWDAPLGMPKSFTTHGQRMCVID